MDVLFVMKLALQGSGKPLFRCCRGVPIYVKSPLRLDNIGKKMQDALYLCSLAPPALIASIQDI